MEKPHDITFVNQNVSYDNKVLNYLKFFLFLFVVCMPIIFVVAKHNELIYSVVEVMVNYGS